jgi:hypothetical protein
MEIINASELVQTVGEQYPLTRYSIPVIIILVLVAFSLTVGKKFAEKFAEDLYSWVTRKINKFRLKEAEARPNEFEPSKPEPTKPFLLSFAVPQRNPNFTGRKDILADLRTALSSYRVAAWKQALTGLGGKGKSQIAAEYAFRYQEDYRFVWWLRSEEPTALAANYAGLSSELGLPEKGSADQTVIIAAVKRWLGNNSGWLLIFDNAGSPEAIEQYLPREGAGHAIITSQNPNWGGACGVIPVEEFERKESIEFILKRTNQTDEETAGRGSG